MSDPQGPRDEALRRFDERYDALRASNQRTPRTFGSDEGAGAGYRLIGELIGGVLTGLGLGWLFDRFAGTAPFGLIGGVLIGSAGAIYLAVRSAARLSAKPIMTTKSAQPTMTTKSAPPTNIEDGPGSRGSGEG